MLHHPRASIFLSHPLTEQVFFGGSVVTNMTWDILLNAYEYSPLNLGTALTNSTTLTDISPGAANAGQAFVVKASNLKVGMQFRVRAAGIVSTTGTPNLTTGLYWGGTAGTALGTTGALAT